MVISHQDELHQSGKHLHPQDQGLPSRWGNNLIYPQDDDVSSMWIKPSLFSQYLHFPRLFLPSNKKCRNQRTTHVPTQFLMELLLKINKVIIPTIFIKCDSPQYNTNNKRSY